MINYIAIDRFNCEFKDQYVRFFCKYQKSLEKKRFINLRYEDLSIYVSFFLEKIED